MIKLSQNKLQLTCKLKFVGSFLNKLFPQMAWVLKCFATSCCLFHCVMKIALLRNDLALNTNLINCQLLMLRAFNTNNSCCQTFLYFFLSKFTNESFSLICWRRPCAIQPYTWCLVKLHAHLNKTFGTTFIIDKISAFFWKVSSTCHDVMLRIFIQDSLSSSQGELLSMRVLRRRS